ncbi:hypothetical protein Hanom_Chr01g00039351 [Helianthus anomalus]
MDITRQMAMAAFRTHKFSQRTGRNKWESSFSNSASVPFKLHCYICHEHDMWLETTLSRASTENKLMHNLLH